MIQFTIFPCTWSFLLTLKNGSMTNHNFGSMTNHFSRVRFGDSRRLFSGYPRPRRSEKNSSKRRLAYFFRSRGAASCAERRDALRKCGESIRGSPVESPARLRPKMLQAWSEDLLCRPQLVKHSLPRLTRSMLGAF